MSNRLFKHFPMFILIFNFLLADVFMTEITDPQNSNDVGGDDDQHSDGILGLAHYFADKQKLPAKAKTSLFP